MLYLKRMNQSYNIYMVTDMHIVRILPTALWSKNINGTYYA